MSDSEIHFAEAHLAQRFREEFIEPIEDFQDPKQEWRRLFSEFFGTFFLVLVAAGGGMMSQAFPNTIGRSAAVVAPGLMVMAIILFMGKVSGPTSTPRSAWRSRLRGDFPWRRVPGYIVVQLVGRTVACLFLRAVINVSAKYGSNYPAHGFSAGSAFWMEFILTLGLVSVILGTASGSAEHRHPRRDRRRRLHRARRPLGQPDLRHVDEPGPHVRPRPGRPRLDLATGCTSPGRSRAAGAAVVFAFVLRGRGGGKAGSGSRARGPATPRSPTPTRPEPDGGPRPKRLSCSYTGRWTTAASSEHRRSAAHLPWARDDSTDGPRRRGRHPPARPRRRARR